MEEQIIAKNISGILGDYEIEISMIESILDAIRKNIETHQFQEIKPLYEYWRAAFDAAKNAESMEQVKDVVRKFVFAQNEYSNPNYVVVQGIMKATINVLKKKIYQLRGPKDITISDSELEFLLASAYMRAICEEIAAENNETVEEANKRIQGSK